MIAKPLPNEWAARRIKDNTRIDPEPDAVKEQTGFCLRPSNPLRFNHNPKVPVATQVPAVNYLNGLTMKGRCILVPLRPVTPFTGNAIPVRITLPERKIVIPLPRLGLTSVPLPTDNGGS